MALVALLIALWLGLAAWRRRVQTLPHWKPMAWTAAVGAAVALVLLLIDLESQKLAVRIASPLGLAWLALFALALDLLRQRRWWPGGIAAGCWVLLTLGGNAWIGSALLRGLEDAVPPPLTDRWDAIAVLGGGTTLTVDGRPQLGESGDRLRVAEQVFRQGRAPLLVALGSGMLGLDRFRDHATESAALWRDWGVPEASMLLIPGPVNTAEEIARLAAEARARGWRRIAVVTSAWHLPRALALARRHGLAADGLPADHRGRPPAASPIFLVPCGEGFTAVRLWQNEVLGRLVGR